MVRSASEALTLWFAALAFAALNGAARGQQIPLPPELPTQWEAPPGDPLEHMTAGLAKVLCSALFITGRDLATALDEDGFFVSPRAERAAVTKTVIDDKRKIV